MKLLCAFKAILVSFILCLPAYSENIYRDRIIARYGRIQILSDGDECIPGKTSFEAICVAGKGMDKLGRAKLEGWGYSQRPSKISSVSYFSPNLQRVTVNGDDYRYVYLQVIHRYFDPGSPGMAPSIHKTGDGSSSCSTYGTITDSGKGVLEGAISLGLPGNTSYLDATIDYSGSSTYDSLTSCSINGPSYTVIPGIQGTPSGFRQDTKEVLIDCVDLGYYERNLTGGGRWRPIQYFSKDKSIFNAIHGQACNSLDQMAISGQAFNGPTFLD